MRRIVFADTLYWIALAYGRDPYHQAARRAEAALVGVLLVTTEEVLVEVVNGLSKWGPGLRLAAASLVRDLLTDPLVEITPQTHDSFTSGLALHERRPDKGYSLTDCISMVTMRARHVSDVLTHDHHFTQEGFTILL